LDKQGTETACIVAIDGPAGAGKSTVARRLALTLAFTYIDTGAMYRAVALRALETGADTASETAMTELARYTHVQFSPLTPEGTQTVLMNGNDVTMAIRTPEVSQMTSAISAIPGVRRVIVEQQQRMGREAARGVVLEGRDIGTVVFPEAQVKVFLTASPQERARRRHAQLQQSGRTEKYEDVLRDQFERDHRDSQRADSPLKPADDAVILRTDGMPVGEVVARILELCRAAMPSLETETNRESEGV
jgi:cytidylate kinase